MPEIGATLRETRMRERIDITEADLPRVIANLQEAGRLGGAVTTVLDPDPVLEDEVAEDLAE